MTIDPNGDSHFQLEDDDQVSGNIRNLVYICPIDHVGTSVFVKGWLVPASRHHPIVLVHDLGETSASMGALAANLAEAGYNVYSFDQRGHGQSGRRLGHIPAFSQLALDLLQVMAWVKHKEGGRKPVIVSQGLGALVALFFAKGHSKFCQGLVFASPMMVQMSEPVSPYRRFVIHSLAELFPTLMIPQWLCPSFTSDQPLERRRSSSHPKISAFLANELLLALSQAPKFFQRLTLPSLILCPTEGALYKYEGLKVRVLKHKFADRLTLKFVDTPYHRLLSGDPSLTDKVAQEILGWLAGFYLAGTTEGGPTAEEDRREDAEGDDGELADNLEGLPPKVASLQNSV